MITNATDTDDVVMGLTYTAGRDPALGDVGDWNTGMDNAVQALSDDGMGITWKIASSTLTHRPAMLLAGRLLSEASWPMPLRWEMAKISP